MIHVIQISIEDKAERYSPLSTGKREIAVKLFNNLVVCFEIWFLFIKGNCCAAAVVRNYKLFFYQFYLFVCSIQCFYVLPLLIAESGEKEIYLRRRYFQVEAFALKSFF